jgi:hypothetical protein
MKRKFKIRFHLGQGENFMKWRVEDISTKHVLFFEPNDFQAVASNCKLYNQKSASKKIHDGANKTVCAWIMAESVFYEVDNKELSNGSISYNPRKTPNWIDNNGINVDNNQYDTIKIINKNILI